MTHGSLFSGIGGFELGAKLEGIRTIWNCEIEEIPRVILKKRFKDTKQYEDIRFMQHPEYVDIISGGFPCQDISVAGKGTGIRGGGDLDCGVKCLELFGRLDPSTSSLKTVQLSLFEVSNKYYATFPKSGIMQNGNVYMATNLAQEISGKECMLLPTPTKIMWDQWEASLRAFQGFRTRKSGAKYGTHLSWTLKLWYLRNNDGVIHDKSLLPNPCFVENLMTFPINWTGLKPSEMR